AYIATRNPVPAQHLLDILFTLKQPELEERLWGFSNAIAELIEGQKRGTIGPPGATDRDGAAAPKTIELVSISKPIWAYGVETMPGILPAKTDGLRRVAFAQLAILAQHQTNADPLP